MDPMGPSRAGPGQEKSLISNLRLTRAGTKYAFHQLAESGPCPESALRSVKWAVFC